MKIALAILVKGVDSEAEVLDRCLHYASKAVDHIFITVTHEANEIPSQKVYDICNKYGVTTSKFQWIKDFATARNFNFSQVGKDFTHILWLDADDVYRDKTNLDNKGSGSLKKILEIHPEIDCFSMFYLYAFDEYKNATVVHQKTRVIKNNGCVEWSGNGIHEDFKENRTLTRFAIDGIDILHLTDQTRIDTSKQRNYDITKSWLNGHEDDPRSYWNLANSAFGAADYDESLKAFEVFMEKSHSDEEKYIARLRMSDVYWVQGNHNLALDQARYALGMRPEYPDAYHVCGRIYYQLGQFDRAKDMFLNGLGRPAPYYKILVYNPREYDYTPLMNLAKCYYALNLPQLALPAFEAAIKIVPADKALKKTIKILKKESLEGDEIIKLASKLRKITDKVKLKKQLDKVPEKFKFHPEILRIRNTNFIKTTSSGRDLAIFCGFTEEEWTAKSIEEKGSGGSEEAIVTMAQGLTERGWNVTIYNNCGHLETEHKGVIYKPYMGWNYRDKQDVVILWRNIKPLDWEINADKIYLDMHDVIPAGEFTSPRIDRVSKIFFKSEYHKNLYPIIPQDKTAIIPNGIDPTQFTSQLDRDNTLIINTSSPVRSLTSLIEIMKEVRKEVPEAKMKWAYGWITTDGGMKGEPEYPVWKKKILEGMKEAGIEDIGRLTHKEIAKLYQEANIFLYPTGFPEIDCISLTKALFAGCWPITTDYAALGEKMEAGGSFIHLDHKHDDYKTWDMGILDKELKQKFAHEIIQKLKTPVKESSRKRLEKFAIENYSWDKIINQWNEILK